MPTPPSTLKPTDNHRSFTRTNWILFDLAKFIYFGWMCGESRVKQAETELKTNLYASEELDLVWLNVTYIFDVAEYLFRLQYPEQHMVESTALFPSDQATNGPDQTQPVSTFLDAIKLIGHGYLTQVEGSNALSDLASTKAMEARVCSALDRLTRRISRSASLNSRLTYALFDFVAEQKVAFIKPDAVSIPSDLLILVMSLFPALSVASRLERDVLTFEVAPSLDQYFQETQDLVSVRTWLVEDQLDDMFEHYASVRQSAEGELEEKTKGCHGRRDSVCVPLDVPQVKAAEESTGYHHDDCTCGKCIDTYLGVP